MTSALAGMVQAWFTSRMATLPHISKRREDIYSKAERLLEDRTRIETIAAAGQEFWLGNVRGDHGTYKVAALSEAHAARLGFPEGKRFACRCKAGRIGIMCSHAHVGEEMRLEGEDL